MSSRTVIHRVAAIALVLLACAALTMAQVKTETSTQKGAPSTQTTVERGEVVYVSGNEVIVKMENGEIRHITVPDGATGIVDGKTVTVAALKPGMKLQRTISTTTTPKTIKTVRTGTATVLNVMPPNSVTVRFDDNTVAQYKIPKGTTFTIDGEKKTAFDLKKGMKITATRIVEAPSVEVTMGKQVTGSAPPPPPPPDVPILIATKEPTPAPEPAAETTPAPAPAAAAAPEPKPKKLPTTGSPIPLIGALGLLFSAASLALRFRR
jgi:hypothetical protein